MFDSQKTQFEHLEVYKLSVNLADNIWDIVIEWNYFSKDTVGKQLVRAADSVSANIAEGSGRGSYNDNKRFAKIARGSLYETHNWLNRASKRNLISEEQVKELRAITKILLPKLNAYIKSIGTIKSN